MKRLIVVISLICGAFATSYAQSNLVTVKDIVENFGKGEYSTRATFAGGDRNFPLTFLIEDQDYIIPVKLVQKDLGAEKRFQALNIKEGDTLVVKGTLDYIKVTKPSSYYDYDLYKGLDNAVILDVRHVVDTTTKEEPRFVREAIPFQLVETKPSFRGGDANEFSKWVDAHIIYPEEARNNGVQGKVMLQFTVESDGSITDVLVTRGVNPALDKEAVRVVSLSPKWKPGKQRDKAVRVSYTFPVIFDLEKTYGSEPEGTSRSNVNLLGRRVDGDLVKPDCRVKVAGTVVVSVLVDVYGNVKKAIAGAAGTTIDDAALWDAARNAAMRTHFSKVRNVSSDTPELQEGTITYIFKLK